MSIVYNIKFVNTDMERIIKNKKIKYFHQKLNRDIYATERNA